MWWRRLIAVLLLLALKGAAQAQDLSLHLRLDVLSPGGSFTPDIFRAFASPSPSAAAGLDTFDLLKPPAPPAGNYALAKTTDTGTDLIADYRPLDPNMPDVMFPVLLAVHSADASPVQGTIMLTLTNTPQWQRVHPATLAYLKRYDAAGVFQAKYDLRDYAKHDIQWFVDAAAGQFARVHLVIRHPCVAADFNADGTVDLADFARLAEAWRGSGPEGDVNGDEKVDFEDVFIMAQNWLCRCDAR